MKRFTGYYFWLLGLAIIYLSLVFIIPPDASTLLKYGISAERARFLSVTVAAPVVAIWFIAFYGFIKFKEYAHLIRKNPDGQSLAKVADGLMVLAFGLPVPSLIVTGLNYVASRNPALRPTTTIFGNYVSLLFVLIGFYVLYVGSRELYMHIKERGRYKTREQLLFIFLVLFSVVYSFFTLINPVRQFPTSAVSQAAYYMNDFALITTIIIPYILVWFFGLYAVYFLLMYRNKVKGVLYKRALATLAGGLGVVIVCQMGVRLLTAFTTSLNNLTLKLILVVLYFLLLVIAIGYIMIAFGAKRLKKIEEV